MINSLDKSEEGIGEFNVPFKWINKRLLSALLNHNNISEAG